MGFFFPDPPKFDDSAQRDAQARLDKEQKEKDRIYDATIARKRGGYAGTVLTGGMGLEEPPSVAQTLLGGNSDTIV
tara:strand:- start:69 stop:296 length:228 start_codon:yes stop_codon:yes gene_type:complete